MTRTGSGRAAPPLTPLLYKEGLGEVLLHQPTPLSPPLLRGEEKHQHLSKIASGISPGFIGIISALAGGGTRVRISAKLATALLVPVMSVSIGGCASTGNAGTRPVHSGRGVPWTIQCMELQGPGCQQEIERIAEQLRRTQGVRAADVFTRIGDFETARLYYGVYYCRTAPKTRKRITSKAMNADLALMRRLGGHALPTRYPFPDVGNPEWDLKNVPAEYSLQVAAFEPTDKFAEYKQAAAAYCKILRDRGYEAYYFHGTANSVVTVGRFGREAVTTPKPMSNVYSAKVRAMQRDEVLKYNLLNGSIYRIKNAVGELVAVPSRLVLTPQAMQRREMN